MDTNTTPWSDEIVRELNRYQKERKYHPYTCDKGHDLIATTNGWVCSVDGCKYTQNWAHGTIP